MTHLKPKFIQNCISCNNFSYKQDFFVSREDKFAVSEKRKKNPAHYFECLNCGLLILDDTSDYQENYSDGGYYESENKKNTLEYIEKRFQFILNLKKGHSDNKERVKRFLNFSNSKFETKLNILDVGAGMGVFFFELLKKLKYNGVALELDPYCEIHLKKIFKNSSISVTNNSIDKFKHKTKFDFVTINRVLEHIYDPISFLIHIKNLLSEEGYIYVEVPDSKSLYNDGKNNEAFGYGHYYVFTPESLENVFIKSGFKLYDYTRCIEPSGKFTLYGFFGK